MSPAIIVKAVRFAIQVGIPAVRALIAATRTPPPVPRGPDIAPIKPLKPKEP